VKLIEREGQLKHLDRFLAKCLKKKGQIVLLDGPSGVGKTEMLRSFIAHAEETDALILNATCSDAGSQTKFGVLSQLFNNAAVPPELTERAKALVLSGEPGQPHPTLALQDSESEAAQVAHGLCLALFDLATRGPLLIVIDDVQYADVLSQDFLLQLIRQLGSAPILAVLTDDSNLGEHSVFRAELLRQLHLSRIRLTPLSLEGTTCLLAGHLGDEAACYLSRDFFKASGGNPRLLHALIEDHRISGTVGASGYGLAFVNSLRRGGPEVMRVAQGLAVIGERVPPTELATLVHFKTETVSRAIHAMMAAGLLNDDGFPHPAAQRAVLDELTADERSALHGRTAQVLIERGAPTMTIARHLLKAGRAADPTLIRILLDAAEHARLSDELHLAVDCLELVHESCTRERDRTAIRARLAQTEWAIDPSAAARHLTPLVGAVRAGQLDRRDSIMLIRQLLWHGRADEAVDILNQIRGSTRQDSTAAAELHATELWLTCVHPSLARRRRAPYVLADHKRALILPKTDPWLHSTATLAEALADGQSHQAVDRAEQVLRGLQVSWGTFWAEESAMLAIMVLICADRPVLAAEWCDRLLAEAAARQAPTWQATFACARAEIAARQGEMGAAINHCRAAMTYMPPKRWGVAIGFLLGSLILAATRMGDYRYAATHLNHPVPQAMFESRYGLHYLHARGHYYLATGHCHAALTDFLSCGELMRSWGLDVAGLVPWRTSAAEAWLCLGNHDQARQLIQDQLIRPGADGSRVRALSLRLLAATSPARRRPHLLTEALELSESCGDRFEQARVLADLSRTYHELATDRRARMIFRRALHVAKMCQATPLCEELLGVAGLPADSVAGEENSVAIEALTTSERRVASLAVAGYTNREISAKLYVTESTVEQHLTRVYRKLAVRGRKELPIDLATDISRSA